MRGMLGGLQLPPIDWEENLAPVVILPWQQPRRWFPDSC
jgi:hypothetical protein